jgi:hypothetical protein
VDSPAITDYPSRKPVLAEDDAPAPHRIRGKFGTGYAINVA